MISVSIIIPALNEERYLPRLLESLIKDTSDDLDIIVVDGNSKDGTAEVAKKFAAAAKPPVSIKIVTNNKRGVSHARNLGVEHARHETLIFLDADTVIPSPEDLREFVNQFISGRYAAASCRYVSFESDWRASMFFTTFYLLCRITESWYPHVLGSCIITTKNIFHRTGGFDPDIKVAEDANFVLKASKFGRFKMFKTPIYVSARRFIKDGYLRMAWVYVHMFLRRIFFGEIRNDKIPYEFGEHDI